MASNGSKYEMDVFINQHKGFMGKIKMHPQDFVVTEIDLSGNLVQLHREEGAPSEDLAISCAHEKIDADNGLDVCGKDASGKVSETPKTASQVSDHVTFDESMGFEKLRQMLQDIIGAQMMKDLEVFSDQELSQGGQPVQDSGDSSVHEDVHNLAAQGNFQMEHTLSVGVIPEKDKRAFLHKAIQFLFPHLKTSTVKSMDNIPQTTIQISSNSNYWDLRNILSDHHETEKIIRFASSTFSRKTVTVEAREADSKEKRTAVHRLISKHFGKFLETKTCTSKDGNQEVVVRFREKYSQPRTRRGVKRKGSGEGGGKTVYTGFVLKKTNLETLDALQQLGRVLEVQPSDFSYAGVKDKKAVTIQSVAVKGIDPKRLKQLISNSNLPGMKIGNIHPLTAPIRVGDLSGNMFNILIRDVHCHGNQKPPTEDEREASLTMTDIDRCFSCVMERGFVNYFGEQRFGLGEINSAAVGQSILAGNFEKAVQQILAPDGAKDDPVNKAKRHFKLTGDPKKTLALMPRYKSRECIILRALHRHGLDREGCKRALFAIPHTMRQLYVHAFCSLVWNHVASVRLRMYGYRVVAGDLVLADDTPGLGTRDKIKEVTESEAQTGAFSIQDVVLPLLGNSIRYPSNQIGSAYTKYLEEAGLGSCSYRITELQLNVPGDYRRLIERPKNLKWEVELNDNACSAAEDKLGQPRKCTSGLHKDENFSRDDSKELSALSDGLDDGTKLSNESLKTDVNFPRSSNEEYSSSIEGQHSPIDQKEIEHHFEESGTNLRVSFQLPSSTYATVFLRELMKQ